MGEEEEEEEEGRKKKKKKKKKKPSPTIDNRLTVCLSQFAASGVRFFLPILIYNQSALLPYSLLLVSCFWSHIPVIGYRR